LISSFIGFNDEPSSNSANVRRFERYANGANEFLKTVECGGTPMRYTFFNPLIRHLFTGKSVRYQAFQGDRLFYLSIRPISSAERGVEAMVGFACQHFKEPTEGFYVAYMLRLSESTNIFDVIIKCIQAGMTTGLICLLRILPGILLMLKLSLGSMSTTTTF